MIRILFVGRALDAIDKRDKVLVSDWELLKQTVLLKESEGEVNKDVITEKLDILEHVKVPLFNLVHDLENVRPLSGIDINDLPQTLLVFFKLILVCFSIFSVQFFQEIVEVLLKPRCGVIHLLGRQIYPGFGVDILLPFTAFVHSELEQFAVFDYLSWEFGLFFDSVWNWKFLELVEDVDNRLDQVILFGLMPKATFVALNTSDCNDDDSDQSEHAQALERDASH